MTIETVGFVGLGNMGLPMVCNLARAGFRVIGFDRDPARRELLQQTLPDVPVSPDISGLAHVDVLVLMVPDGAVVREVLIGDHGIARELAAGGLIVDMSSSDPVAYEKLEPALAERGLALVDAPVSGGVAGARDGTLAIMAGGRDADLDRAEPLFDAMGRMVFRTGALGSGQVMKALNNLVSAGGLIVAIEALMTAKKAGLDPALVNRILNASTGRNNSTERKIEPHVLDGAYDSGFALALMAKDVRTALNVADRLGVAMPLAHRAVDLAAAADEALGPGADHTEIARYLERLTGVKLP